MLLHSLTTLRSFSAPAQLSAQAKRVVASAKNTDGIPVLSSGLTDNDVYTLLDFGLNRALGTRSWSLRSSIPMSLAARESSVLIEGMYRLERQRLAVIQANATTGPSSVCDNWIDVGGAQVCSEEDFWLFVGSEQKLADAQIELPQA